jgi:hypothetical protein
VARAPRGGAVASHQPPQGTRSAHGTQPGDPAKAAKAIITAVGSDEPPAFLLLGNDALRAHRRLAAARLDTIQTWEHLPTSTDIDI